MFIIQDHPSSDSFYDSDFADGEPTGPQVIIDKSTDKDSEGGSQPDQFENPEIDGEKLLTFSNSL